MDKHAKFWLTIGSFLTFVGLIALMILIIKYAKLTGNHIEWSILTIPPIVFSAIQTCVNYLDLTEDK